MTFPLRAFKTAKETARILGTTEADINRLVERGYLRPAGSCLGKTYFDTKAIERYLKNEYER
jgi:predicted transcriptional regulator